MSADVDRAAKRLILAAESRTPCAPVRDLVGATDQAAAYEVQALVTEHHRGAGMRIIGRKIGLTSRAVQAQLGVDTPDFGTLLDDMAYADREPIALDRLVQPRVEAEVAFVLGRDIDTPTANVADVLLATDYVVAALEVVDSRITGWDITLADTVADNASSGVFVLGTTARRLDGLDLVGLGMVMEHRGTVVSTGAGAACLGSPVAAVAWLARALGKFGAPLRAGDIVLSGALGPVVPVAGPGSFTARLSGLGDVTAVFVEGAGA